MSAERVDPLELDEKYRPYIGNIFKLNLVTEAGTYIKEFVHSDFGRTRPNLASLLGNCTADIITLDVMVSPLVNNHPFINSLILHSK